MLLFSTVLGQEQQTDYLDFLGEGYCIIDDLKRMRGWFVVVSDFKASVFWERSLLACFGLIEVNGDLLIGGPVFDYFLHIWVESYCQSVT